MDGLSGDRNTTENSYASIKCHLRVIVAESECSSGHGHYLCQCAWLWKGAFDCVLFFKGSDVITSIVRNQFIMG